MNIRNIKVRFNLDRAEDAAAYEILRSGDTSMSRFVITAVNAYGCFLTGREEQRRFLLEMTDALRSTLMEIFGNAIFGGTAKKSPPATTSVPNSAERSGEIADDFLENLM